jgi:pilus assembly protein CpaB
MVGIVGAVILAGLGTYALVSYVDGAESRALEGETLTTVLIVDDPVPAGTPAEQLAAMVREEQVPQKVRAVDAVTDLSSSSGLVAAVDLVPGEQLVSTRLVLPGNVRSGAAVQVPAGLVEVTVDLTPSRALGGLVGPGDTVAVLASFEVSAGGGAETTGPDGSVTAPVAGDVVANTTHVIAHKVLVTAVQATDDSTAELERAPAANLLVTLAVPPADAERIVFTAEFGRLWLAGDGPEVDETSTQVQSRDSVYRSTRAVAQ